jgi:hypothetical protein
MHLFWEVLKTLGDGAYQGEVGHWRHVLGGLSYPSPPLFPIYHEGGSLCNAPAAMMFCLTMYPGSTELWTKTMSQIHHPFSCLCQVFCLCDEQPD